jgi:alkaline phosphatase
MRVCLPKVSSFALFSIFTVTIAAQAQHAKKIILILGDGAGLSSLNAASLYGYGAPQSLYLQHMPNIAWVDTSSASEWVFAVGPGSSQIKGFIANTNVFHYMLDAYGWNK